MNLFLESDEGEVEEPVTATVEERVEIKTETHQEEAQIESNVRNPAAETVSLEDNSGDNSETGKLKETSNVDDDAKSYKDELESEIEKNLDDEETDNTENSSKVKGEQEDTGNDKNTPEVEVDQKGNYSFLLVESLTEFHCLYPLFTTRAAVMTP